LNINNESLPIVVFVISILLYSTIEDLKNLNINDQLVENGIIIPNNSIFIKEKEIKKFRDETERLERLEVDEIAQNYRRYSYN